MKIISKIGKNKPGHYYEIQIDTKRNQPEILNGRGEGDEIPAGERGRQTLEKLGTRMDRGRPRHARDASSWRPATSAAAAASTSTSN